MKREVVHLHVHTDHSLLDGAGSVEANVKRAAELGMPAIAVTDHGSLGSAYKLWKEATAAGIKPIIGLEAYVAPDDGTIKTPVFFGNEDQRRDDISGGGQYLHITLLAQTGEGVRNLFRLHHWGHSAGFYGKPRIDFRRLAEFSSGIICLSGCPSGHIQTHIRLGQPDKALEVGYKLQSIFGDRFFIELMDHGLDIEKKVIGPLIGIAAALDVPMVATADSHYVLKEDAKVHETLLAIQTRDFLSNPNRFKFDGAGYHLLSYDEMVLTGLPLAAIQNTVRVAEMVESYDGIFQRKLRIPKLPGITDENETLRQEVFDGLGRKGLLLPPYIERAEYELPIVAMTGFPGYFLALQRIMELGRINGIRFGPARGSAAGALTAFATDISSVDPLGYGLLFERFLNPDRLSEPDIDIDIDDRKRDWFLSLVRQHFGYDFVAQINTYGMTKAKSAIKDVVRVHGEKVAVANRLIEKLPPPKFGRTPTLSEIHPSVRNDPYVREAQQIEGVIRSQSIHASGVIISDESLVGQIPLRIPGGKQDAGLVTELTMNEVSDLGFIKMDFLGLNTIGAIDYALQFISKKTGVHTTLPTRLDDPDVFRFLSTGDTTGIFQLESLGMRRLLKQVRPKSIIDIASVLALYRPGPMGVNSHKEYGDRKNGRSTITYPHHEFIDSLSVPLSETYGIIVFQEQVLEVLKATGGYTYGTAELIFNAMRKKDTAKMEAARPDFESRLRTGGFSRQAIEKLWDVLVPFSDYSFNKSHSVSYAIISYYCAYLKYYHPWEFWAGILSQEKDTAKLQVYIGTVLDEGIPILPPDLNESEISWTPTPKGIRFGLKSISGISDASYSRIRGSGPYSSMRIFWEKAPLSVLNMRTMGALVKAGCFDGLCADREGLYSDLENLIQRARDYRESGKKLYTSFDIAFPGKFSSQTRKTWEKEVLGTEISKDAITFTIARWLSAKEWWYVKRTLDEYPGRTPVDFQIGPLTKMKQYAKINPDPRLFVTLRLLGIERADEN